MTLLWLLALRQSFAQLLEQDRVAEYHARGWQWPPPPSDYAPRSPGWRSLFRRRFEQTARLADPGAKYNAYMSVVHAALLAPNFTEFGWGLTRAPPDLTRDLLEHLLRGLEDEENLDEEDLEPSVEGEYPLELPLMVPNAQLNRRAMRELKPIHEAWSGVKLIPNNAYGLRVYRNQSNLQMHIDESATHIISSILHVGHDPHGEPYPLVIEDLHGNTNEVFLETGDLLLYESSKCFHGRPKRYNGKWYSSLFTHFYPEDWDVERISLEAHYRIPPEWEHVPEEAEGVDELVVTETSFKEPNCEHEWCGMKDTIQWKRPAGLQFGEVLSGDGNIKSLGLNDAFAKSEEL